MNLVDCAVLRTNDMMFVITENKELKDWGGNNECVVIDKETFDFVSSFVTPVRFVLDSLMRSESPGTILYWERDYHSKLAQLLSDASGRKHRDISNALSSLGL